MKKLVVLASILIVVVPADVWAQQAPAPGTSSLELMQQQIKELQERVITLEGQLRMMHSQPAPANTIAAAPAAPPATPQPAEAQAAGEATPAPQPRFGGATALAKALNPDISMIGDFLGSAGGNSPPRFAQQSQFRSFEMHESELGIQAIVDPYARGDFFITFGEQGVGLEEGYITFTSLPAGFVARVGKMRAAFGKVNTLHNHVLPWADRPLVTDNLVGGEDGINDAGLSITRAFAGPRKIFFEGTGQVFRGDSGDSLLHPLFASSRKNDVSTVAHLRGYKDITESTNVDIGVSFARGHSDLGNLGATIASAQQISLGQNFFLPNVVPSTAGLLGTGTNGSLTTADVLTAFPGRQFITYLYGADATLRWKPLRRSIYHSFIGRGEFIWNQRQQLNATTNTISILSPLTQQFVPATKRSFGFYASADYQLARRWFLGGRYDSSERVLSPGTDHGTSLVLTYWPSEFSQLRAQYRSTRYAEGINANELLGQVQFVLGAHGAHPF